MCPSTDPAGASHEFATDVLRKLLHYIAVQNGRQTGHDLPGHRVFQVSHAWTDGPMMYLVYQSPSWDITWGLARDTRESLVDSGPWVDADNPSLFYFLLDFEEGWSGRPSPEPGKDPDIIRWRGDQCDGLPESVSDIPVAYRHKPTPVPAAEMQQDVRPPAAEPRRYADPS